MGHTRLGKVPKSKTWMSIVQLLTSADDSDYHAVAADNVEQIASQAIVATQNTLRAATNDIGLKYTFYLLARVALASRANDWLNSLAELGIHIRESDSLFEFTLEFQSAIDEYLIANRHSSDISEMAQQAAGEALTELVAPKAITLFGSGADELRLGVRGYSTKNGFSELGQKFFGTFLSRFINFYLSRVTAGQSGNSNLPHVGELSRFNEELQLHCEQSARIVRDFCGEWYSKTEYQEGINLENTSRFVAVAMKKLEAELKLQEADL